MNGEWKILEVVGTDQEATILAGFLNARGVPCEVESLVFHQEPVNFGRLGEVRLRVPAERLGEARRLLEEQRALAADGDSGAEEECHDPEVRLDPSG